MPPKQAAYSSKDTSNSNPRKRKDPPTNTTSKSKHPAQPPSKKHKPNDHRAKQRDARTLATQTSSRAFTTGALDVDKFVKAREYEIRALEQGMRRSRGALNRRAFQQVPKELRRRGAAHDVKKVVKRLRGRARKEMIEDNTPTVNAKKRKPTRHQRLRLETVKRLRALGAQRKKEKEDEKVKVVDPKARETAEATDTVKSKGKSESKMKSATAITSRQLKIKKAALAKPPLPKAKFRKRQKNKSWLPTHIFHAKRAHMTPPSAPMWRFALPLSPTQKSYRSTHRASSERGAVCWDTSYMATIGLEGEERSLLGMLKALGLEDAWLTGTKGNKWRTGTRALKTVVYQREQPHQLIAPVTAIWCASSGRDKNESKEGGKQKRKLFLRVHPSAFFNVWEEVVRLSKVAKPAVNVEDLRFEIGSIELKGPGSTEALLAALWPSPHADECEKHAPGSIHDVWTRLAGLTNAGALPAGALLAFCVQDPKLHFPPRTVKLPKTEDEQAGLFNLLAEWPPDSDPQPPAIFDGEARRMGSRLPSQKAVNRRKSLARPGQFPEPQASDPQIPVLLYASTCPSSQGKQHQSTSWHLLAPRKAIQPIWYSLMYYPLSTGQQPRFGGMIEHRQLAFEAGAPWFPGDFPGTKAGWEWEVTQRRKRWEEWKKRPKGKRVAWESVQVGEGKEGKGEVGIGWACDWELLLDPSERQATTTHECGEKRDENQAGDENVKGKNAAQASTLPVPPPKPKGFTHMPSHSALEILKNPTSPATELTGKLQTVRIALLTRGVPQTRARIYRLPSDSTNSKLRKAWMALHPSHQSNHGRKHGKHALPRLPKGAPPHILQQRLAASLLEPPKAGGAEYPACPGKEDLVGFVTSGSFNLADGNGTGVGCLLFEKVVEEARKGGEEGRLCIVRNAGESVGRLGLWDVV